ncbi:hypothetical protein K8R42_05395 [bacterium]|nr:hypothetical protein [bacterium]
MKNTLYWIPRIFGILFVFLVAMLAFDMERFAWLDLLIHLIPALVILVSLLIGWKQEKIGGALFIILGVVYIIMSWGNVPWLTYLVMAGPAFVIGILFLIPKSNEREVQYSQSAQTPQTQQQPAQPAGDAEVRDQAQD